MEDENVYRTTNRETRFKGGRLEFLNDTPMQPPVGYKPQPSLLETIREQIKAHHLANIDMEPETEEEADDFDISDDPVDPTTPWENDHIPSIKETRKRIKELEKQEQQFLQMEAARAGKKDAHVPAPRKEDSDPE